MRECSRSHLRVAGPARCSGTWRLNRKTGSIQCRPGRVPPHNRARTTLPAQAVEFAGSQQKPVPARGAYQQGGRAAPPHHLKVIGLRRQRLYESARHTLPCSTIASGPPGSLQHPHHAGADRRPHPGSCPKRPAQRPINRRGWRGLHHHSPDHFRRTKGRQPHRCRSQLQRRANGLYCLYGHRCRAWHSNDQAL
jgi:hypothetical protein